MKFRALIQTSGKTATGLQVPAEVVEALGSGKRPAVQVSINGYTYRSTVAPMGLLQALDQRDAEIAGALRALAEAQRTQAGALDALRQEVHAGAARPAPAPRAPHPGA